MELLRDSISPFRTSHLSAGDWHLKAELPCLVTPVYFHALFSPSFLCHVLAPCDIWTAVTLPAVKRDNAA